MTAEEELRLRDEGVEWRAVEGEIVALDTHTSQYVGINRSGAVLWALVARGTTRRELVATLAAKFGIGESEAATDVDSFVAELRRQGLLA